MGVPGDTEFGSDSPRGAVGKMRSVVSLQAQTENNFMIKQLEECGENNILGLIFTK